MIHYDLLPTTFFFYASNTMGKHIHVRMTKNVKTRQRCESELTRSLRGINICVFFLAPPKGEGTSQRLLTRCTRNTQISVFFRGGVIEPPAPTIYIHIYCIYIYIYIYTPPLCMHLFSLLNAAVIFLVREEA